MLKEFSFWFFILHLPATKIFQKNKNGSYSRGKIYGDFSAKSIKLSVTINKKAKQVYVYASFFGVLFDTGDVWQVTSDIVRG